MKLQVKTPGRTFEFSPREGASSFVVGNRAGDDLTIDDDPEVSGPHVRVDRFGDNWSFTDQFSDGGTFHNGEKKYSNDLKQGDVLKIGRTELKVLDLQAAGAPDSSISSPDSFHIGTAFQEEKSEPEPAAGNEFVPPAPPAGFDLSERPSQEAPPDPPPPVREAAEASDPEPREVPEVFVERISNRLATTFEHRHGPIRDDRQAMQRIREAARRAVIELEDVKKTEVNLSNLRSDGAGPLHLKMEIERKHLHDEFGPSPVPEREPRRPSPVEPRARPAGANPNKPKVLAIATGIAIFAVVAGINFFSSSDFGDSDDPPPEVAELCGGAATIEDSGEDELLAQVNAMRTDTETPPQQLLDRLNAVEAEARKQGFRTGWDYESARTIVENRVYSDVSKRYGETSRRIGELHRDERYRDAKAATDSLVEFLESSPHHERAISTIRIPQVIERWQDIQARKSSSLVADNIAIMAEALSRDDYQPAADAAGKIHASAILEPDVLAAVDRKQHALARKAAAAEQAGEKPKKPFDRRDDELPETPENSLLPSGDTTGWNNLRRFKWDFADALKAGELDDKPFQLWGMTVRAEGVSKSSQVDMHYSMELEAGVTIAGVKRGMLSNEHPRIELNVYLLYEELTADNLLGLLVSAFNDGLMDEAARIAYLIRRADESSREPLDEILSAKWGVPVPEGGFPERAGHVVPG